MPCLRALCELADVVLVVTQPDRPAGRGMKLAPPPVRTFALERGMRGACSRPRCARPSSRRACARCRADVALVVAYGRILPAAVLQAPRLGCVNVHASLLPGAARRGADPVGDRARRAAHRRVLDADGRGHGHRPRARVRGARHRTGRDRGRALAAACRSSAPSSCATSCRATCAASSTPQPQDHARATLAPMLEQGARPRRLPAAARARSTTWCAASASVAGRVRAPRRRSAASKLHRVRVLVARRASTRNPAASCAPIGTRSRSRAAAGVIAIEELQPEGKRRMSAAEFCAGSRLQAGARFATPARMKIYTKTGDGGQTGLFGGARVSKADARVDAYGEVDELNCALGAARAQCRDAAVDTHVARAAERAVRARRRARARAGQGRRPRRCAARPMPRSSAWSARSICSSATCRRSRRSSCRAVRSRLRCCTWRARCAAARNASSSRLPAATPIRPELVRYLNRLSDLLFVTARHANFRAKVADVPWLGRKSR